MQSLRIMVVTSRAYADAWWDLRSTQSGNAMADEEERDTGAGHSSAKIPQGTLEPFKKVL